jgi:hypothetical protein
MKVNGLKINLKGKVFFIMKILINWQGHLIIKISMMLNNYGLNMKVNLMMIVKMEKEYFIYQMANILKENSSMILPKEKVSTRQ